MTEMVTRPASGEAGVDLTKEVAASAAGTEVTDLINNNPVMMFALATCPFCTELKATLKEMGVQFSSFDVDRAGSRDAMQTELTRLGGLKTYPMLFVDKKCLGGCMDVKRLIFNGSFASIIAPYQTLEKEPEHRVCCTSLFYFPETANSHVARATALLTMVYVVLAVAFWRRVAVPWVVLAMAIDFTLRFFFGPQVSPVGMLASLVMARLPPKFTPGAPKQFAAFIGSFMSIFSAGLFLGGEELGGVIVFAVLIGATLLEGVFDFCLGCWIFSQLISFGVVSPYIYRPYSVMKHWRSYAYDFMNAEVTYDPVENKHLLLPGQTVETPVDLIRKPRLELEYKLRDWHPIKHLRIELFGAPMAIAALAFVYYLLFKDIRIFGNRVSLHWGTARVYHALAITSASVFCALILMYFTKLIMYPKKVCKEWKHPVTGPFFSAISICLSLYGFFMFKYEIYFAITLIWMGAAFQMFIAVMKMSDLVYNHMSADLISPTLMMAPVGCFVSALTFAAYSFDKDVVDRDGDMNYLFISRFWFAVAALFAITLFIITFRRSFSDAQADPRLRPALFIWLATAAIFGPAYLYVSGTPFSYNVGRDLFFQSLWFIALFFFAVTTVGVLRGFFTYTYDMAIWIMAFSYSVLSINTIFYYFFLKQDLFTLVLVIISVVIASTSSAVCLIYTLYMLLDASLFKPRNKWGPVSFMKLSHESVRDAIPLLQQLVDQLDTAKPHTFAVFAQQFTPFALAYRQHAQVEDEVLFPAVRRYFPGLEKSLDDEHAHEGATFERMIAACNTLKSGGSPSEISAAIETLKGDFASWGEATCQHMRHEENTVTVVVRKYIPLAMQKQLTNDVWNLTAGDDWAVIIPYTLDHLKVPMWKVRFLRTFIWAQPERAQEVGLMVYRGVDTVTWAFLAREIPEMVPRGLCGWTRHY